MIDHIYPLTNKLLLIITLLLSLLPHDYPILIICSFRFCHRGLWWVRVVEK